MRLEKLTLRNVGPFDLAEVDLTALPDDARLVAVVGENGAGKSTLLAGWPGAIYRSAPRLSNLTSIATARDSMIEARVVNGAPWTFRQMLDGVSRKSEALVLDADGNAVLESTKVTAFDAWIRGHIMPPEVFYASIFGAQGAGGFIEAKPADRKAILCRVLGIEHLEAVAERCREEARAAKGRVATLEARLADERERGGDVEALTVALDQARQDAEVTDGALVQVREALALGEAEARRVDELAAERRRIEEAARALADRALRAGERGTDLDRRIANNRAVLDRADEIRQACATVERLDREIDEAERKLAEIGAENERRSDAARSLRGRYEDARAVGAAATRRAEQAELLLADREKVEQAPGLVEIGQGMVAGKEERIERLRAELRELEGQRLAGAEERIDHLRGGLGLIATGDAGADHAAAVLEEDNEALRATLEAPQATRSKRAEIAAAEADLAQARRNLDQARALAARLPAIEAAAQDLAAARAEAEAATDRAEKIRAELDGVASMVDDAAVRRGLALLQGEREHQAKTADMLGHLEKAEARIEELEPQLAEVNAELAQVAAEREALPGLPEIPAAPNLGAMREAVERAERAAREAAARVPVAEQRLADAQAAADRIATLDGELSREREALADWTRLAADLGKDGLQALEIDAAGPELTEIVNDLLHSAHGSRWSVKVETTRLSSDGKRELEGLEVTVIDTEAGREAAADEFSGGERVFLGEAVSLALSVMACRRAGIEAPTLARDESGAALDPANGRRYIAMLRRVVDIVGASRVLYVSHTPELQELADARIVVGGGKAVVA